MAILYGEYGPYDSETGMALSIDPESGGAVYSDPMVGAAYTTAPAAMPDSSYFVRGDYRMPTMWGMTGGPLEIKDANGNWSVVTAETAPAGYDPRQDSNAQGSNERLSFNQAFGTAPADIPITEMQNWAMANGWTEPDRSNNEGTLGAMIGNIAPYAGLMLGGIGAMGGLGGMLGSAGSGALATGDAMAGLIPAGELGAWTGAGTLGSATGSASTLGDLLGSFGGTGTGTMGSAAGSSTYPGFIDAIGSGVGAGSSTTGALAGTLGSAAGTLGNAATGLFGSGSSPSLLGTGLSAGASLIGAGMNASAASDALAAQQQATNSALGEQRRQFDLTRSDMAPWLQSGGGAVKRLADLIGVGENKTAADYGSLTKPFSMQNFTADPGYKFRLDQGQEALQRSLGAKGLLNSGNRLMELTKYGQDMGSQEYGNAYNRYNTDQTNIYNRLAGVAGTGQNAANTLATTGAQNAGQVSNLLTNQGNADAASQIANTNAWTSGLSGAANSLSNYFSNQQSKSSLADLLKSWGV